VRASLIKLWLIWAIWSPPSLGMAPILPCPASASALDLPTWANPKDPRLQSKTLVVVLKNARLVFRLSSGNLVHTEGKPSCWSMGLGPTPLGHKRIEGDGKTPQGWYRSSDKPWSSFYGAIAIHYPNAADAQAAKADGRIDQNTFLALSQALKLGKKPAQNTPMGGEILIHGGGSSPDWTLGCIAMDNHDLDTLRASLSKNMVTDVLILP